MATAPVTKKRRTGPDTSCHKCCVGDILANMEGEVAIRSAGGHDPMTLLSRGRRLLSSLVCTGGGTWGPLYSLGILPNRTRTFIDYAERHCETKKEEYQMIEHTITYAMGLRRETLRLLLSSKFPDAEKGIYRSKCNNGDYLLGGYYSKMDLVCMFLYTFDCPAKTVPLGIFIVEKLINGAGAFAKHRIACHIRNMASAGILEWYYEMSRTGQLPGIYPQKQKTDTSLESPLFQLLDGYTYDMVAAPFLEHYGIHAKPKTPKTKTSAVRLFIEQIRVSCVPVNDCMKNIPLFITPIEPVHYVDYPANVLWFQSIVSSAIYNGSILRQARTKMETKYTLDLFNNHFKLTSLCGTGPASVLHNTVVLVIPRKRKERTGPSELPCITDID